MELMPQKIKGTVRKGKGEGRITGFPTANILLEQKFPSGIYAGTVVYDGKAFLAAIFVPPSGTVLEAHLLDFAGTLYDAVIEVEIIRKIRDSVPYTTAEDMQERIIQDIENVRRLNK